MLGIFKLFLTDFEKGVRIMGKKRKIHFEKELLKQILKGQKLTIKKLCEETGLYYETILYAMKTGEIMPDLLETIAEYMDLDFYYLTGESLIPDHYDQGQEKTLYKTGLELFVAWLETIKPLVDEWVMDENKDVMKRSFHSYPWSDFENDFNELSRNINNDD